MPFIDSQLIHFDSFYQRNCMNLCLGNGDYNMKKIQKGTTVKDDQNYLQGINLVTGDKIDYNRHMLSQTQIGALCVDEKLPKLDKFLFVLANGEKIQKWSIFENLMHYVENQQAAQTIFTIIEKNYPEYESFVSIMGEGVVSFLQTSTINKQLLSKKCYDIIYRIMHQILTAPKHQGSDNLLDWMEALTLFFRLPADHPSANDRKVKLQSLKQYINGSFSMNTLPERRKTALMMINALLCQSKEVQEQAYHNIVFFNNDLNPSTRLVICDILMKILSKNNQNSELWKIVIDYYFHDKSVLVKERAFKILSNVYSKNNIELIFDELGNESTDYQSLVIKFAVDIFKTFGQELRLQRKYQFKVISFLNRLLRQNQQINLKRVLECYTVLSDNIMQNTLVQQLQLKKFELESIKVIKQLIKFHKNIEHLQFKEDIKKQIKKGIRYHEFDIKINPKQTADLLVILDCTQEEDLVFFTHIFSKQIQNSKWSSVALFLDHILTIKFYQSQYEKVIQSILKIYNNCPYFLLDKMHEVILYLLLNDRKNQDLYQKIKDKFMGSRCWMHRRNYIKLYLYIKKNASHEFNRTITQFAYKNLLNQKNVSIKMEFIRDIQLTYPFIDPTMQMEKMSIKEIVTRMNEEKDRELIIMASQALKTLRQIDKDYNLMSQNLERNKQILEKEIDIEQVQSQTKKHIKTDKNIRESKEVNKLKRSNLADPKAPAKLITISNGKMTVTESKGVILRSSSSQQQPKKELPKFNLPIPKKRGKM